MAYLETSPDVFKALKEIDQNLTQVYNSTTAKRREVYLMATAIKDPKQLEELMAHTRERGLYKRLLEKLPKDEKLWDVTEDHPGKKVASVKIGYTNAIETHFKGQFRCIVSEEKVYIVRL